MKIRPIALALIVHRDRIFVMECFDKVKNETFYRPLGGGIEFGETGEVALKREFIEEMNAELTSVEFLKMFENIFVFDGIEGYEIVLFYQAEFKDKDHYLQEEISCNESGVPFIAKWVRIVKFTSSTRLLYPDGLVEYLVAAS